MRKEFGEWLREQIKQSGKTQAEFSGLIGVEQPQLSRILSGERGASNAVLVRIASVLGLPPESIFRKAGEIHPEPESSERIEEALYVLGQLDPEDVDEIIEIARLKLARKGGPPPATPPTQKLRKSRKPAAPPL